MSYNSFKAHKRVAWVKDKKRGEDHDLPHRFAFATVDGTTTSFPTIRECEDMVIRGKATESRKERVHPSPPPDAHPMPENKPEPMRSTNERRMGKASCPWCASLGYDRCLIKGK